ADSCKVFFYQVGGGAPTGKITGVGVDVLDRFAHLFGLGEASGIDLVEEVTGLVPTVRWKRQTFNQEWEPMDTYQMAVGAGFLTATPLQMANVVATLANGGTLYRPQLVLSLASDAATPNGSFRAEPLRQLPVDK